MELRRRARRGGCSAAQHGRTLVAPCTQLDIDRWVKAQNVGSPRR